jgi:hypothetical protein
MLHFPYILRSHLRARMTWYRPTHYQSKLVPRAFLIWDIRALHRFEEAHVQGDVGLASCEGLPVRHAAANNLTNSAH